MNQPPLPEAILSSRTVKRFRQSYTAKAGYLLFLLGLIILATGSFSAADIIVWGNPSQDFAWALPIAAAIAGLCFVVGAGLIECRPWARVLGAMISLISLAGLWLGIIGVLALYYLVRGWREQPVSRRALRS